jgi:hypothetical protein
MKRSSVLACAFGGLLSFGGVGSADAALLLSGTFDTYADQAAFQANWGTLSPQPSGVLSTNQSVSPTNSIQNVGTTVAGEAMRNQRLFTESGNPSPDNIVTFSFDFYDSNAARAPYRQHSNLQDSTAASASGQLISMGLNNNLTSSAEGGNFYMARILGFNGTGSAFFKLNDDPALLRTTGWHNLKVEISDTAYRFYVDNQLAETVANTFTLRSYDVVRLGSGLSNAGDEAYYDNVVVTNGPVPEPATLGLLAVASLGVLSRRRRA